MKLEYLLKKFDESQIKFRSVGLPECDARISIPRGNKKRIAVSVYKYHGSGLDCVDFWSPVYVPGRLYMLVIPGKGYKCFRNKTTSTARIQFVNAELYKAIKARNLNGAELNFKFDGECRKYYLPIEARKEDSNV